MDSYVGVQIPPLPMGLAPLPQLPPPSNAPPSPPPQRFPLPPPVAAVPFTQPHKIARLPATFDEDEEEADDEEEEHGGLAAVAPPPIVRALPGNGDAMVRVEPTPSLVSSVWG